MPYLSNYQREFRNYCLMFVYFSEQWLSLCSLMSLVECEGVAHQSNTKAYIFPNTFFHTIVTHLLDDSDNRSNLIGRFTDEYLKYDDVRYYWLKNIS